MNKPTVFRTMRDASRFLPADTTILEFDSVHRWAMWVIFAAGVLTGFLIGSYLTY